MSDSVIAFKKRLVQLKNVLVTKRKIAEQLFYKTFKLDDNKSDREIILAIMKKNDMKTKRGNIVLDTKDGNEEKAVKSFLKEALPFLLTAFGVEKETVSNQEKDQQEKPAATGLFAMQEEIDTGDIEPENILTSSTVSEPNSASMHPETQSVVESQSKPTPQTSIP
ncbi:hypothetical protein GF325_05155, partial [Candidatus Bathyarchaeota archaeon]|nr:hypothetical protein [Candidatus Bathyarchaeota archaeon]